MTDVCFVAAFTLLLAVSFFAECVAKPWQFYPYAIRTVAVVGILLTVLIGIVTRIAG